MEATMNLIALTFELLYDLLTAPQGALKRISKEEQIGPGLLVLVFTLLLAASSMLLRYGSFSLPIAMLSVFGGTVGLLISVALVHLLAVLLGGHGSIRGLFAAYCFSSFPVNFSVVFVGAGLLFHLRVTALGDVFLTLWILVLYFYAVRETYYGLGSIKSGLAVCWPGVLLAVTFFAISSVALVAAVLAF